MRRIAAAVPLALLALAGCGQGAQIDTGVDDLPERERPVAQVIADLTDDGAAGDEARICDRLISEALTERIEATGTDCRTEMRLAIRDADGFDLRVRSVDVPEQVAPGARATVEVEATDRGDEVTRTFSLVREDELWKIERFSG